MPTKASSNGSKAKAKAKSTTSRKRNRSLRDSVLEVPAGVVRGATDQVAGLVQPLTDRTAGVRRSVEKNAKAHASRAQELVGQIGGQISSLR